METEVVIEQVQQTLGSASSSRLPTDRPTGLSALYEFALHKRVRVAENAYQNGQMVKEELVEA